MVVENHQKSIRSFQYDMYEVTKFAVDVIFQPEWSELN